MISVIIPIYNVEQYLEECIDSVLNQTYKDLEIILVDDGSTDSSGKICDKYLLIDDRVVVIHKLNGGLVSARKSGLNASTGKYVGYVDGDDWIEPDMYECLYKSIENNAADFAMCSCFYDYKKSSVWRKNGIEEGEYNREQIEERIFPILHGVEYLNTNSTFGTVWNKLFSRKIIAYAQIKVPDFVNILEDILCSYITFMSAEKISVIDRPLYHYRQRSSSMLKQTKHNPNEMEAYRTIYLRLIQEYNLQEIHSEKLLWQIRQAMYNQLVIHSMELCPDLAKKDELYPFRGVKKKSKVVLYGAGTYGQCLLRFFIMTKYCDVVMWTDSRYADYDEEGLSVESPEKIADKDFDCVVIAILSIKAYKAIYNDLIRMNIPPQKICWVDRELIESDETWKMFGMPD